MYFNANMYVYACLHTSAVHFSGIYGISWVDQVTCSFLTKKRKTQNKNFRSVFIIKLPTVSALSSAPCLWCFLYKINKGLRYKVELVFYYSERSYTYLNRYFSILKAKNILFLTFILLTLVVYLVSLSVR